MRLSLGILPAPTGISASGFACSICALHSSLVSPGRSTNIARLGRVLYRSGSNVLYLPTWSRYKNIFETPHKNRFLTSQRPGRRRGTSQGTPCCMRLFTTIVCKRQRLSFLANVFSTPKTCPEPSSGYHFCISVSYCGSGALVKTHPGGVAWQGPHVDVHVPKALFDLEYKREVRVIHLEKKTKMRKELNETTWQRPVCSLICLFQLLLKHCVSCCSTGRPDESNDKSGSAQGSFFLLN